MACSRSAPLVAARELGFGPVGEVGIGAVRELGFGPVGARELGFNAALRARGRPEVDEGGTDESLAPLSPSRQSRRRLGPSALRRAHALVNVRSLPFQSRHAELARQEE